MGNVANWEVASIDDDGVITANGFVGQNFGTKGYYSSSGAITLTDKMSEIASTTSELAMTLANGTEGQVLYVRANVGSENIVITPTFAWDGATLTFSADGTAILIFDGDAWFTMYTTGTWA